MSKEELEIKINKIVKDGFQMDYDREDNLVNVFKQEEVVDNIMFELDEYVKQELDEALDIIWHFESGFHAQPHAVEFMKKCNYEK